MLRMRVTQNHRRRALILGIGDIANTLQRAGRPTQAEFGAVLRKTIWLFNDLGIWHALMSLLVSAILAQC